MARMVPRKTYLWVWIALEIMVGSSYGFSRISMGPGDVILPLLISATQTLLVILYYMHVRWSQHVVWVYAGIGFAWLAIFIDLTLADYLTRGISWSQ